VRLLVVSHPSVMAINQLPYAGLMEHGWEPFIVAPARWRHEYSKGPFPPEVLPELSGWVIGRRVVLDGKVQRHFYITDVTRLIKQVRPDGAFVEQEPTSAAGFQWARALGRAGIPFGLQCAENLERPWPLPARVFSRETLGRASFVAARSPAAARIVHLSHPDLPAPVIPHHLAPWSLHDATVHDEFVVGFAGRLVPEKGLHTLIDSLAGLDGVILRLVGNGPLRDELVAHAAARSVRMEIISNIRHEQMASAYAGFDVLVLPSLTTPTWTEQFGRVLIESMWCKVPVIGSDSGEIPWVINSTGGGLVVPENDPAALRRAVARLRDSPELRRQLADRGCAAVRAQFSVDAVARALDGALRAALSGGSTSPTRLASAAGYPAVSSS